MVNWAKWFKIQLHKEMIVVQRKARKVRNSLIKPTLILVEKHYDALEYTKEDEKEPIAHFQRLKKTRKMMLRVPSIPLVSVNLVATSSQVEILPMEEEQV
jgi:hypothetical protein